MPKLVYGLFAHKMPKSVEKEKKVPKTKSGFTLRSLCTAFGVLLWREQDCCCNFNTLKQKGHQTMRTDVRIHKL
jgi:hypothetical protein